MKDARDLARKIGVMAPDSSVKLDILRKGEAKTVTLTLGKMPNERQAKADTDSAKPNAGVPHLGLTLAPANDVAGAGGKGVVVAERRSRRSGRRARLQDRRHHPRCRRQGGRQCRRRAQGADRGARRKASMTC